MGVTHGIVTCVVLPTQRLKLSVTVHKWTITYTE